MAAAPDASVQAMLELCDDIDRAIRRGDLSAKAVQDLKRALDETRMRVWASMEAARSGDPDWVQEFWLQRVVEICVAMVERLQQGEVDGRSPRVGELRAVAERLVKSIEGGAPA